MYRLTNTSSENLVLHRLNVSLVKIGILRSRLTLLNQDTCSLHPLEQALNGFKKTIGLTMASVPLKLRVKMRIVEQMLVCPNLNVRIKVYSDALTVIDALDPRMESAHMLADWAIRMADKANAKESDIGLLRSA